MKIQSIPEGSFLNVTECLIRGMTSVSPYTGMHWRRIKIIMMLMAFALHMSFPKKTFSSSKYMRRLLNSNHLRERERERQRETERDREHIDFFLILFVVYFTFAQRSLLTLTTIVEEASI